MYSYNQSTSNFDIPQCMSETCSLIRYWFFFNDFRLWYHSDYKTGNIVLLSLSMLGFWRIFLALYITFGWCYYKPCTRKILGWNVIQTFIWTGRSTQMNRGSEHWSVCVSGEIWSHDSKTWDSYLLLDCLPGNWVTSRAVFSFICCRTNLNQNGIMPD